MTALRYYNIVTCIHWHCMHPELVTMGSFWYWYGFSSVALWRETSFSLCWCTLLFMVKVICRLPFHTCIYNSICFLVVEMLISPSLWSGVEYLNNCRTDCHENCTDIHAPQRMNPVTTYPHGCHFSLTSFRRWDNVTQLWFMLQVL